MKHIKQFLVIFIALFPAISLLNVQTNNADEINNIDSANVDETISEDNATNTDVSASEQNSDEQPSKDTRVANEFNVDVTPEQLELMPADKYKFSTASEFQLPACVYLKDIEDDTWYEKAAWAFADNDESMTIDFINVDCPDGAEPTTIIHCTIAPDNITGDLLRKYYTFDPPRIDMGGRYFMHASNDSEFMLIIQPDDMIIVDSEWAYKTTLSEVTMTRSEAIEFFSDCSNIYMAYDKIEKLSGVELYWYNQPAQQFLHLSCDKWGFRQAIPGEYQIYAGMPCYFPIMKLNIIEDHKVENSTGGSISSSTTEDTKNDTVQPVSVVTETTQDSSNVTKAVDTSTTNTMLFLIVTLGITIILLFIVRYKY